MNNDNSIFSRRQALAGMTLGGALVATDSASALQPENQGTRIFGILNGTQDAARPPAFAGQHSILPLPFNAAKLNGISEKLITSHHDNNYAAAVKNLNKVEADLAKIGADTPAYQVAGLHERELLFRNSKTLHEAYFANLGGNGQRSGAIEGAISTAYGSAAAWETQFRATCMSLGGGSGWVVLAFELFTGNGIPILHMCSSRLRFQVTPAATQRSAVHVRKHLSCSQEPINLVLSNVASIVN